MYHKHIQFNEFSMLSHICNLYSNKDTEYFHPPKTSFSFQVTACSLRSISTVLTAWFVFVFYINRAMVGWILVFFSFSIVEFTQVVVWS